MVDRILRCLQKVSEEKQIFLCGHSLGGGLVTMLSLVLPARCPASSQHCVEPWGVSIVWWGNLSAREPQTVHLSMSFQLSAVPAAQMCCR